MTWPAPVVFASDDDSRVRRAIRHLTGSIGAGYLLAVLGIAAVTALRAVSRHDQERAHCTGVSAGRAVRGDRMGQQAGHGRGCARHAVF
jgi:hypothetical protein